ncbi:PAS domain-containing hybrid sensor histidine kinase/response regulator [Aquimarina brevivitae]|uniref:histidine kinase n=1 Tax=Aquimarina brevivitae TaxID=323412 RepID=A0A4Q7P174_9FLAO|nr:PAS domain-containing protein [Aquimarina brevivitae]RZS93571.1 PAS domain S-box-containing protein [Aquimarina brevivitae]
MKNVNYLKEELYKLIKTDETIFDFIQESSLDGLWYWDLEQPEEEWMNPKFWDVLGYDYREMPHKSSAWQDIIHPDDLKLATENFIKHCENPNHPYDQTVRYTHKNGSIVWIRCRGLAIRDEQGKPIRMLGAHQDITQFKNSELLLQKNADLLRNAQRIAKIGSWELNLITNEVVWTEELYNMYEFNPALPPPPFTEHMKLYTAESWELLSSALELTREHGTPYQLELKTIRKDGSNGWIWVQGEAVTDENKKIIGLKGIAQDITERKQKEEADRLAIAQEQMFSKQMLENMADGFAVTDAEGRQIIVNKAFCEMTGFSEDELIGQTPPYPYWPAEELENIDKAFQQTLTGNLSTFELTFQKKSGKRFPVQISTSLLKDEERNTVNFFANVKDITEQKTLELEKEALIKSLNYALDASGDGIWDWTPADGKTIYSKAWVEMLGYKMGELAPLASEWSDRLHPDDIEWVFAAINHVTQTPDNGDTFSHEYRFRNKEGNYLWILNRGKVVERNERGEATRVIGTHTDMTDRKKTELILQESEKKFRELFENLIDEVHLWKIVKDKTGKITGWQLVDANPSALKSWGKSINDIIGKTANEIFEADAHTQFMPIVEKIFKTYTPYHWESYFPPTDQYLYMESIPFGDYFISTGKDITEQKKSEQALKDSELRLSLATQAGGVGVWDWDIVNNILTWDEQMFTLYGVKREQFSNVYEAWYNGVYDMDREQVNTEIELALKGKKVFNTEFRIQTPNREIRNIRALATVIRNKEDRAVRMIGTNWDITKEKEALKQIKEAKEQAEAASKAKSEFLANMSHEIRTPLNGVIGFTELLTNTPLNPVQQQYVKSANVSGHTLLGIINDILDFSKIEAGMLELEITKTDMVELLENSIDIVKYSTADKELELLLDIDPAMPRFAHLDSIRTKQILANLLSNAVKFTQKGEVALKLVYQAIDNKQGKFSFSVRDTGIGITEEQKAKLFKSFSQADSSTTRRFGGTGLGLVISQMIAEKMGSKINIDSTPNVGTTFSFDIIAHFEEGEKPDIKQVIGIKRCLIIDDNANNQLILKQMLKQWQIESDYCNDGLEALKRIASSKPYDVIICDYNLPYSDGLKTIRMMRDKLKLNSEKLPVILLYSSLENIELEQKYEELGILFRLNKPVKSLDLFNSLSNLHQSLKTEPKDKTEQVSKLKDANKKIKIIIAEDNPLNMVLSKTILSQLIPNSEVYEAKNGLEAVEQYKNISPDLIIMDIHMPELDGIEATKQIRAMEVTGKRIPIIALTAGAMKEEKDKCFAAGIDDFLTKPIVSAKIQTVLHKFFQQEKKVNDDLQNIADKNEIHFRFSKLTEGIANDMDIAQDLITMFMTNMPTKIDRLVQACHEKDLVDIKALAHSIKGSSLSMYCDILADIAGKIENATKENFSENIEVLISELNNEWEMVKKLLLQKINH